MKEKEKGGKGRRGEDVGAVQFRKWGKVIEHERIRNSDFTFPKKILSKVNNVESTDLARLSCGWRPVLRAPPPAAEARKAK